MVLTAAGDTLDPARERVAREHTEHSSNFSHLSVELRLQEVMCGLVDFGLMHIAPSLADAVASSLAWSIWLPAWL